MADLSEVKSSRKVQNNIKKFESLSIKEDLEQVNKTKQNHLSIVDLGTDANTESTPLLTATSTKSTPRAETVTKRRRATAETIPPSRRDSAIFVQKEYLEKKSDATLVEDAREILRHQPSLEDTDAVLAYLKCGIDGRHDFNIKCTSPQAAMVIRVIATHTIPDIWPSLTEKDLSKMASRIKTTLLEIMFSVTGIEALLGHIQVLSKISQTTNTVTVTLLDFLTDLLKGSKIVLRLLHDTATVYEKDIQRQLFWKNVVALFGGSRILSTTAATKTNSDNHGILLNGTLYSKWLAANVVSAAIELLPTDTGHWANLAELLRRGLSLGYRNIFVAHIYTSLLLGNHALWAPLHSLMNGLPSYDQKIVLDCILDDLSQVHFRRVENDDSNGAELSKVVAGAAGLLNGIVSHNQNLVECLVDWVSTASSTQATRGPGIRRTLIALLAGSNANLECILERSLMNFGNKSLIQNVSISQQEHLAQIILLVIGYLHRQNPPSLLQMPIPSLMMNATSNRLASSIPRPRLLGMIVAVGMSQCIDEPSKTMDFGVEEMETDDVKAMLALVQTQDKIGDIDVLKTIQPHSKAPPSNAKKRKITTNRTAVEDRTVYTSKIIAIEEVSSSSDEDDLVPYQKPTDDPEDSDEDPTLINRDKPHAPIYIIDLIKQLQSPPDKLDIISLALKTAPNLIRRKAGFGTEVSDNIHALVAALVNLQDGMSKSEHQQQRLDALVACMVAQPKDVAKILANTYFNGDFSLSQRVTILTAIGLGAREIAGFDDGKTLPPDAPDFSSQRLPPHIQHNPIQPTSSNALKPMRNVVSALTNMATADTIRPLAESAAQKETGPSVLKVTRMSARLGKAQQQTATAIARTKRIPRDIYSILVDRVYLPLASPLSAVLAYASTHPHSSTSSSLMLHPSTLSLHIQTLTLILHTLGPGGLSVPATYYGITHETLLLLTHLSRTRVALDGLVLPAFLALLLALVDLTVEIGVVAMERLVGMDFGPQVAALVRWTALLRERNDVPPPNSGGRDGNEERGMSWTVLAAGIQVKWVEIGQRFQNRMFGLAPDEAFGY